MAASTPGTTSGVDRPGLPFAPVDAWLRDQLPELTGDGPWAAEIVSGGLSNITYRLHLAGGEVILRRPPLGGVLPSAHDMAREYRVLAALTPTAVPVPEPLALGSDPGVLGYPFYVMRAVPGAVLRTGADVQALTVGQRRELAAALVATLADLHAVDVAAVGLGDYGRPEGYAARQIRRWAGQWDRSRTRELPDMAVLLERLATRLPARSDATIVHGDYRLDNTIVDLTGAIPRLAAVVDWELSTLGDPLADLGLALTYWPDPADGGEDDGGPRAGVGLAAADGFPTRAEFAEQYAARTGRDLAELAFYLALAAMKLAVIMEGVHARYLHGHTVSSGYERAGEGVPAMVAQGLRQLAG